MLPLRTDGRAIERHPRFRVSDVPLTFEILDQRNGVTVTQRALFRWNHFYHVGHESFLFIRPSADYVAPVASPGAAAMRLSR